MTVRDIAGNGWLYRYSARGELSGAAGPNGQTYLTVAYDTDRRVAESFSGRLYAYAYAGGHTTVTEGTGELHTLSHSASGITTALSSSTGVSWRVSLDSLNRVSTLSLPERRLAYTFDTQGTVSTVTEIGADGIIERAYEYGDAGRLVQVLTEGYGAVAESDEAVESAYGHGDAGRSVSRGVSFAVAYAAGHVAITAGDARLEYSLSDEGIVTSVREGTSGSFYTTRNEAGDIVAITQGDRSVRLSRDSLGRIVGTVYPSGTTVRHFYDRLGNRYLMETDHGSSVGYSHDAAGNIVGVEVVETDGLVRRQNVTVGSANSVQRVDYVGSHAISIEYDQRGRPVEFDVDGDVVSVEYRADGRLARMTSTAIGEAWAPEDGYAPLRRDGPDARLAVLSREVATPEQPEYGVLSFTGPSVDALDPVEVHVPHLREAHELLNVASGLLAYGSMPETQFEKPSNPVFQPAEYIATNCCMPWEGEYCGPARPKPTCCMCEHSGKRRTGNTRERGFGPFKTTEEEVICAYSCTGGTNGTWSWETTIWAEDDTLCPHVETKTVSTLNPPYQRLEYIHRRFVDNSGDGCPKGNCTIR